VARVITGQKWGETALRGGILSIAAGGAAAAAMTIKPIQERESRRHLTRSAARFAESPLEDASGTIRERSTNGPTG